jgi:GNAT superfamily N-acetyltransferase
MEAAVATTCLIRPACEDDTAVIVSLIRALAEYEKLLHEVKATEAIIRETLFGKKPYAEALLAELDGEVVGFCLFFHNFSTFLGRPGIYIEDIFVRPEFRARGIGKQFYMVLSDIAKERGCGRIEWWVLDWNKPAIDFYKKLGAKPMNEWTVYRLTEDVFNQW